MHQLRLRAWFTWRWACARAKLHSRGRRLARPTSIRRSPSVNDSLSIESVVEIVRKLWKAVDDKAEEPERAKLKRDIAQSVDRLKGRIEKSLKVSRPPVQERLLFNGPESPRAALSPYQGTPEQAEIHRARTENLRQGSCGTRTDPYSGRDQLSHS